MTWLTVQPETIPHELRDLEHWMLCRAEPVPGKKPDKVPYRVADPVRRASSTDPRSWAPFADAHEAYSVLVEAPADPRRGPVIGIGVALTTEARIPVLTSMASIAMVSSTPAPPSCSNAAGTPGPKCP